MTKITNDEQIFACMMCDFSGPQPAAQTHAMLHPKHRGYIYPGSKGRTPNYEMNYIERRINELLPSDYYADRTVAFRVKMLVESWRRAIKSNQRLSKMRTVDHWWFIIIAFTLGMLFAEILRHLGI